MTTAGFLPDADLSRVFNSVVASTGVYCGSGVTASVVVAALQHRRGRRCAVIRARGPNGVRTRRDRHARRWPASTLTTHPVPPPATETVNRFHYDDFPLRRLGVACCARTRSSLGLVACSSSRTAAGLQAKVRIHRNRACSDNTRQCGGQRRPVGRHRLGVGRSCTKVKTVLASSSVDPHDYEPSRRTRHPSRAPTGRR